MADKMKLIDWEPYVLGEKFMGDAKERPVVSLDLLGQVGADIAGDQIAKQAFDMCEKYTDFYEIMPDAKAWIPMPQRQEVFYALKCGKYNPDIPSVALYLVQKAWKECYNIPNLILKVLPQSYLKQFCARGFFGNGYCLRDLICNVCTDQYTPLAAHRLKVKHTSYTEIYVESTDMVAAVPNNVADTLTDSAIQNLTVSPAGIAYGDSLLRTMGGSYGITNSIYDLRELV